MFIEGRIQTPEWDDRDGNKRRTTEIVASDMRMVGSREEVQAPGQVPVAVGAAQKKLEP